MPCSLGERIQTTLSHLLVSGSSEWIWNWIFINTKRRWWIWSWFSIFVKQDISLIVSFVILWIISGSIFYSPRGNPVSFFFLFVYVMHRNFYYKAEVGVNSFWQSGSDLSHSSFAILCCLVLELLEDFGCFALDLQDFTCKILLITSGAFDNNLCFPEWTHLLLSHDDSRLHDDDFVKFLHNNMPFLRRKFLDLFLVRMYLAFTTNCSDRACFKGNSPLGSFHSSQNIYANFQKGIVNCWQGQHK